MIVLREPNFSEMALELKYLFMFLEVEPQSPHSCSCGGKKAFEIMNSSSLVRFTVE